MVRCCKYCKKEGRIEDTNQGRTLHGFPLEDAALVEIWKRQLQFHPSFIPNKHTKICSDHFQSECFAFKRKRKILIAGSIPTLFSERKNCCFYCNKNRDSKPGLSLRKFPLNNPAMLEKWLLAINNKNFVPDKDSLICSDHFDPTSFRQINNRKYLNLKDDAVPSIFIKETLLQQEPVNRLTDEPEEQTANQPTEKSTDLQEDIVLEFQEPQGEISFRNVQVGNGCYSKYSYTSSAVRLSHQFPRLSF